MSRVFLFLKAYTLMGGFARGYTRHGFVQRLASRDFPEHVCLRELLSRGLLSSQTTTAGGKEGEVWASDAFFEKVFTGNWSMEALHGHRRGLAGLCETGLGISSESMHLVRRLNRRPLRRHNTERQCQKQSYNAITIVYIQHYLIALFFISAFAKCLRMCQI